MRQESARSRVLQEPYFLSKLINNEHSDTHTSPFIIIHKFNPEIQKIKKIKSLLL